MSSPDKEKHNKALEKLSEFCDVHNEKDNKIKQLIKLLYKFNLWELEAVFRYLKRIKRERYKN